jgi:hypothetical protein
MTDEKVANSELIRLRRNLELREYALAAFYPLTHSCISAHHKRAVDRLPVIAVHPPLSRLPDNPDPPESVAKPWKKPWDK